MPTAFLATPTRRALVIFAVALIVRTAWAAYAQPIPVSDYVEYLGLAQQVVTTGQYPPENFRFPGMVLFLVAVLAVSGGSIAAAVGATVLLSAAGVVAAWLLFRALWRDERVADVGALVVALDPTFVFYAPVLGSEHLLMPLVALAVAAAARETWSLRWRAVTAGLGVGLATLTRGEALFYLLPCAIALWPAIGERRLRRVLPAWLALGAAAALVVLPWLVRNERVMGAGAGLSTSAGSLFYYSRTRAPGLFYVHPGNTGTPLEGLSHLEASRLGWRLGWARLREDPWGSFLLRVPENTLRHFAPSSYAVHFSTRVPELDASGAYAAAPRVAAIVGPASNVALLGWCVVLAPVGLAILSPRLRRSAPTQGWLIVGGVLLANWICYPFLFYGDARYRFVPEAVLCGVAGVALARLRVAPPP